MNVFQNKTNAQELFLNLLITMICDGEGGGIKCGYMNPWLRQEIIEKIFDGQGTLVFFTGY